MKFFFYIIICSFLMTACLIKQNGLTHYLSTLENRKFIVSKEDSLKIDSVKLQLKETVERIKREKSDAVICFETEDYGEFRGGVSAFRQIVYDNFKVSKQAKEGENRIRITVGKQNNLEKVKILKYTDEDSKKAIEDIFKSKELSKWNSARLYRVPVEQQFEISIFIKNKNLRKS